MHGIAGAGVPRNGGRSIEFAGAVKQDAFGHVDCEKEGIPIGIHRRGRIVFAYGILCAGLSPLLGCASMRLNAPSADLRPCTDGYRVHRRRLAARGAALSIGES